MFVRKSLPFVLLAALGCSNNAFLPTSTNSVAVTGNWQFASTAATAATRLPGLSGELTGSGSTITGIVHASAAATCLAPSTALDLTGKVDSNNLLTLSGAAAGGTLTLTGKLATDGKSLTDAAYQVAGGTCAQASTPISAEAYTPISGNYAGKFSDAAGPVITVTSATLTQTPAADTSGNFQLSGTANFGTNPCFASPATITSSQVTGGSFTLTYVDPSSQNSVTASGTFTPDGNTLNVTNWNLTTACGPDTGTGTLTKQ